MGTVASPRLPRPRGPASDAVITALAEWSPGNWYTHSPRRRAAGDATAARLRPDPMGADLQLALFVCYELHYHGFAGVDPGWEWDPDLLDLRGRLERQFLDRLRAGTKGGTDAVAVLDRLAVEPVDGGGLSQFLAERGAWEQMREFFVHRSLYHLKEADPHAWVIPRLAGTAKAALVAVEFDEYGGGRAERMHATLFADLMSAAELNPEYLAYLDRVPPESLATVNLMSMCGLHRELRGALVGLFAAAEITTAPSARRIVAALDRLDAPQACKHFYAEHIEADAVHEQVLRHDVVGSLLRDEPTLAADVVFGVEASELLEQRLVDQLLGRWSKGWSSLLPVGAR
ncbi:MAG TPA: iron-containing redox enzyme family protein [Aldersonia sp.]